MCTLSSLCVWDFAVCLIMLLHCCCCCVCVCLHSGEKEMDNRRGGTLSFTERFFFKRCADVLAERESLHLRGRVRGRERMADSAVRDEVHSFKALIASGKRSHFPNHIHAPIIYFLPPAPILLCLSHSLLQCWGCLSLFLMSAFVQSSPCLSRGELCKCQTSKLWPPRCKKEQMGDKSSGTTWRDWKRNKCNTLNETKRSAGRKWKDKRKTSEGEKKEETHRAYDI